MSKDQAGHTTHLENNEKCKGDMGGEGQQEMTEDEWNTQRESFGVTFKSSEAPKDWSHQWESTNPIHTEKLGSPLASVKLWWAP